MFKLLSANKIRLKKSRLFWTELFVAAGYSLFLLIMNYIEIASHIGKSIVPLNWFLLVPFSVVSVFCPVFTGVFIGTEYSDKTMRNRIIAGHTRENIYLANFLTVCSVNIIITLIAGAVTAAFGGLMFGWNLTQPALFAAYCFDGFIMLTAFAGFFTLIAMIVHNKTASTAVSMMMLLVSYVLESGVQRLVLCFYNGESVSDVFFNLSGDRISQPLVEFLYDFIPMGQCIQITSSIVFRPALLPVYSTVFSAITVISGILIFKVKDIK